MNIHLDFETFSLLSVKIVGAYRYAEDPSTEVLICCYAFDNGPVKVWLPWREKQCPADLVHAVRREGVFICAHNAQFERAIWQAILVKRHGAPPTRPRQFICTAVRAAQAGLPRNLDGATMAIDAPHKKNPDGGRIIKMFCGPRKPTKANPATRIRPLDNREDFKLFIGYCKDDVEAERDLDHVLPPLTPNQQRLFALDMIVNERGLPFDIDLVKRSIPIVEDLGRWAHTRCMELADGIKPTQVAKLRAWMMNEGVELPNLKAETLDPVILHPDTPDNIREVLEIRLEAGIVSTKKFYSMLRVCSPLDGRARGTIMFYGAHTGRWSGKLIQPHNFKRGTLKPHQQQLVFDMLEYGDADLLLRLYPDPLRTVSMVLRGFMRAPDGRTFRVVDFTAIEARVLAWLAGEQWLIDAFNRGLDVYILMAAKLYKVDPSTIDKGSERRRIAKNLTLGCGYQLGGPKFVEYCARAGAFVTEEEAIAAVRTYRTENKMIVRSWAAVENAAILAVQSGKLVRWRSLGFEVQGKWLTILLPSGRRLYYLYPKVGVVEAYGKPKLQLSFREEFRGSMYRVSTYGGRLVENIVQAIAADLMGNGMEQAELHGYEVDGTVHDEAITEGDIGGRGSIKDLEHVVCKLPDWARGIPMGAEGFEAVRYRKG